MRQQLKPGASIDAATPDEVAAIVRGYQKGISESVVRTGSTLALDASGNGVSKGDDVYVVPAGMTFFLRRVAFNITGATDPFTGQVALNVAGKWIKYLRSDRFLEFAIPLAPSAIAQVPGVQTWSEVEGPIFRNLESFEVQCAGLTANAFLAIEFQGLLVEDVKG